MVPRKSRLSIEDAILFEMRPHADGRGMFAEAFRRSWAEREFGDDLQVNLSRSHPGVIRGLHYHLRQTDYWFLAAGRITAVLVDVRPFGNTSGRVETVELEAGRPRGLWIPPGVAHGYATRELSSLIYLVSRYYTGDDEYGLAWDDPQLAIDWGIDDPVISRRDRTNPSLAELDTDEIQRTLAP